MSKLRSVIEADRRLIDAELRKALRFGRDVPARLGLAMRYAVLGPGKRVRPMLALEAFRAAGGRGLAAVLPFCSGIELIHTFSLIHDDLPSMDNDDFRRGRPSLHRKFDEATAILAADGLFAYAFELFARAPGPTERSLDAILAICRAVGPSGMTGGQMMDITTEVRSQKSEVRSRNGRVALTQRKKTAEFIAAAVVGGAILGGAPATAQQKLRQAGLALGMLFQMTDDLLDSEQASEARRDTMVSIYGRARVASRADSEAQKAERLFSGMGTKYRLLAAFPDLVLHRKS
ncbi:MAG: polyprenyl synthetase family protein [candidate division WOR-3 bacterium]|nr:polyprenyl synthetase family protein [candidate division WOR-3 bacterium]